MAILGSMGNYSSANRGGSAEVADLLSYYDGKAGYTANAGEEHRVDLPRTGIRLNILGTIQPSKLAELMGATATRGGGLWPRFMILPAASRRVGPELPKEPWPSLFGELPKLYLLIHHDSEAWAGGRLRLSPEARTHWQKLVNRNEQERRANNDESIEAEYRSKEAGLALRLAALLAVLRREVVAAPVIKAETMKLGIRLAAWAVATSVGSWK